MFQHESFQINELSLEQAITFIALYAYYADDSVIAPEIKTTVSFAPTDRYGRHLLNQLAKTNLIKEKKLINETFTLKAKNILMDHPDVFYWNVTCEQRENISEVLLNCIDEEERPEHWKDQLPDLIFSLALAECQEFFDICTAERNFDISPFYKKLVTDKLKEILKECSVSQCQLLIIESAINSSDSLVTRTCNSSGIANFMIEAWKQQIEEYKENKQKLPEMNENYSPKKSMIVSAL
jgi:hypothetical protein